MKTKQKNKLRIPESPRARTWEMLEKQLYTPEQRTKNRAAGEQIAKQQLLRELRQSRGITQVALARRLGVTQATLSQLENQGDARVSTIRAWAEALGGKLRLVIDFDGEPVDVGLGSTR